MCLNSALKPAVIIALFLSCFAAYSQSSTPFISQLEGLNDAKEAKISMIEGSIGESYTIQSRLKNTTNWLDSPVKIKKSDELNEGIVTGLESNKDYCFRVIHKDTITKTETVSNEVCSINLKSTLLSDKSVRLQWSRTETRDMSLTSLIVMGEKGDVLNTLNFGQISDSAFIFNELSCSARTKFSVRISSLHVHNGIEKEVVIKSPQILVDPQSIETPPNLQSVGRVTIGVTNTVFYNTFEFTRMPNYEFYRSINGGEMLKIGENSSNNFEDINLDAGKNYYCYSHRYISACGKKSEFSEKSCTIKMTSEPLGKLSWTPFRIYADTNLYKVVKKEYYVQGIDSLGSVIDSFDPTSDTTVQIEFKHDLPVRYRVLARIEGRINFGLEMRYFQIASYSNSLAPDLVLGNEFSKEDLNVFPNPAEDKILIKSSEAPIRFVELIDMKGRVIYKSEISGDTFNLSDFEKGKYILRLFDANNKLLDTKSIVKW